MIKDEGLIRAVGVRGLTAGMVNYMIGAGIFVLPAVVASSVGAAAPLIFVICGVSMALIVACFADAGSRVSLSGGTYAYAGVAFGPFVGFIVASSLWFGSAVLSSAAVANVLTDALAQLASPFGNPIVRGVTLVAVYGFFAALNIRGVRIGSNAVQVVTLAKLTPLLLLVAFGLFFVNAENLAWPGFPASGDIARTSVMLMFAFLGIESALTPSGEIQNPARTVPRAILSTLILVTLLYMAIQLVAQGVLGADLAAHEKAPLAETAKRIMGNGGQLLVLIGMAISTFGYLGGDMLAAPRGVYALGRDGLFPRFTGSIHERYRTPHVAILIHAALCAAFAVTGTFAGLMVLATLATLIVYLICCLATIQSQRMNVRADGATPFRVPGGPVIPVLASVVVIWLMMSSTRQEFVALAAMLVIEAVVYLIMRSRRGVAPTAS